MSANLSVCYDKHSQCSIRLETRKRRFELTISISYDTGLLDQNDENIFSR